MTLESQSIGVTGQTDTGIVADSEPDDSPGEITLTDEELTVFKENEVRRLMDAKGGDMVLQPGTVLSLVIKTTVAMRDGHGDILEEMQLPVSIGNVRLGSDLRVWAEEISGGTAIFHPSSKEEGDLRREKGEVDFSVTDLTAQDLAGGNPENTSALEKRARELVKPIEAASRVSKKQFLDRIGGLLKDHRINPDKVTTVELRAPVRR